MSEAIRERLCDAAEARLRTGGYNAVSFRHLADDVGIKSASVHYHFPTKADLGQAVAERYAVRFLERLDTAVATGDPVIAVLVSLFRQALVDDGKMCLCGVIAAESGGLPPAVSAEAAQFLAALMERVDAEHPGQGAAVVARLEGAMLLAHVSGDVTLYDRAVAGLA